jgi:hypothetical protein
MGEITIRQPATVSIRRGQVLRKIDWIGETTQTADAALAGDRRVPDIDRWLRELLANGEMKARDVEEAGKAKNYTPKQIYGARERLGVAHRKANKAEFADTPTLLKLPPQKPVPGQPPEAEDGYYRQAFRACVRACVVDLPSGAT